MADVSTVTNHFPTASETYENNLSSSIGALETVVPVNSANEYDDGDVAVLTVEPGTANEATFTGVKASLPDRFIECKWTEGNLGVGHASGATVIDYDSATHLNIITKGIKMFANQNGTLKAAAIQAALGVSTTESIVNPPGMTIPFAGRIAPTGWLVADGALVSRVTYASLFNAISPVVGDISITIATPGVATLVNHGLVTGDPIHLTTTGALPTGLSSLTQFWVIRMDANTFRFATSYANAIAGTAVNTTGAQSGVHTVRYNPYGVGNGSSTFTLPDLRGRVIAGLDNMGGTSANRLTNPAAAGGGVDGDFIGNVGGAESHTLTTAQQANASGSQAWHGGENSTLIAGWAGIISTSEVYGGGYKAPPGTTAGSNSARYGWTINLGFGGGAHNNVQPTMIMNYIIKT